MSSSLAELTFFGAGDAPLLHSRKRDDQVDEERGKENERQENSQKDTNTELLRGKVAFLVVSNVDQDVGVIVHVCELALIDGTVVDELVEDSVAAGHGGKCVVERGLK